MSRNRSLLPCLAPLATDARTVKAPRRGLSNFGTVVDRGTTVLLKESPFSYNNLNKIVVEAANLMYMLPKPATPFTIDGREPYAFGIGANAAEKIRAEAKRQENAKP